jgi:MSHA biogenesis protein MshK
MMRRRFTHYSLVCLALLLGSTSLYAQLDLPDPTKPSSFVPQVAKSTKSLVKQFKLHSVLISAQRRVAIINEKSVEVGDSVNGATVSQIEKSRVVLVKQGTHFSLSLVDHDFKQRK